jgi:hypothetical protein
MRTFTTLIALIALSVLLTAPAAHAKSPSNQTSSSSDSMQTNPTADTLPEPVQSPTPTKFADFTADGHVGVDDLIELLSYFGSCPRSADPALMCPWDLNGDYSIDVNDIVVLEYNWG